MLYCEGFEGVCCCLVASLPSRVTQPSRGTSDTPSTRVNPQLRCSFRPLALRTADSSNCDNTSSYLRAEFRQRRDPSSGWTTATLFTRADLDSSRAGEHHYNRPLQASSLGRHCLGRQPAASILRLSRILHQLSTLIEGASLHPG